MCIRDSNLEPFENNHDYDYAFAPEEHVYDYAHIEEDDLTNRQRNNQQLIVKSVRNPYYGVDEHAINPNVNSNDFHGRHHDSDNRRHDLEHDCNNLDNASSISENGSIFFEDEDHDSDTESRNFEKEEHDLGNGIYFSKIDGNYAKNRNVNSHNVGAGVVRNVKVIQNPYYNLDNEEYNTTCNKAYGSHNRTHDSVNEDNRLTKAVCSLEKIRDNSEKESNDLKNETSDSGIVVVEEAQNINVVVIPNATQTSGNNPTLSTYHSCDESF